MTSKCHYCFGLYLLSSELNCTTITEQIAFLYGCIEPDLNPGTYLKGSLHGQKLRGHNFRNMLPCIYKLFEKIWHTESSGILYFYRLGKLTHYLTDAFTYPYNSAFCGSLKDHMRYENELEPLFLQSLSVCQVPWKKERCGDPYRMFLEEHRAYLHLKMGKQSDISFVLRSVPCVVRTVFDQTLLRQTAVLKQEELVSEIPVRLRDIPAYKDWLEDGKIRING